MLIWTARLTRKKAALGVIVLGVVTAAIICLVGRHQAEAPPEEPLTTNAQRVAYCQSLGWKIAPEPLETLQFLLPETLEEPYAAYNALQLAQGFDLTACCGKQLSRYTYAVTNYPDRPQGVQLNLYICEDRAVAGDIFSPGADGFQAGLTYPSEER